jgi:hypothetical protein
MLRQVSKRGTGLVVCEQTPSALPVQARTNFGVRCFFYQTDRTNINYVVDSLDLSPAQRAAYKRLRKREYLLHHPNVPFPFIVRIPNVALLRPTKTQIEACRRDTLEFFDFDRADKRAVSGIHASTGGAYEYRFPDEDLRKYLRGIRENPGIGVSARDKKLGLSPKTGQRLREKAEADGLITRRKVKKPGRGRPFDELELTEKGEAILGKE